MTAATGHRRDRDDFAAAREHFPIRERMVYLNNASIGPLSDRVVAAVNAFLADVRDNGRLHYPDWCGTADTGVKGSIARLLGARPEEIAFVKNTTEGLNIVANGFDWREGDNVLVADIEYPSNVYPWMNLERRGVSVKWLATEGGRIPPEAIRAAIDARTRMVSLSAVQFSNGFRLDVAAAGEICRKRGVLLNLDAIQLLGALPLDLGGVHVDFLSAGGHKWLLGPIGTGIFYCRRDAMDRLHPPVVGYHSVDKGEDHMDYELTFRETAGRFEEALVNFPGIWGLAAAVEDILTLGTARIEARITGLIDIAVEGLAARGYGIVSSLAAGERSGILTFRHETIPPVEICRRLAAAGIHLSVRGEGVRMSPGYYNDEGEIRAFLEALP